MLQTRRISPDKSCTTLRNLLFETFQTVVSPRILCVQVAQLSQNEILEAVRSTATLQVCLTGPVVITELFLLGVTAEALRAQNHPIPTVHRCCYLFFVATLCVNKDV